MNFLRLLCVIFVSLSLITFINCSKKKQEDISADEIIDEAEKETVDDSMSAETVKPEEPVKPAEPEYQPRFTESGKYVVQVRAYPSENSAKRFMQALLDKGYPAYVAQVDNPTPELNGSYFRVRVGGFDGVSDAKEFAEKVLISMGYQYWVDNKSNDNVGKGYASESGSSSGGGSSWSAPAASPAPEPAPSYSAPAPEPAPSYSAPAPEPAPAPAAPAPAAPASGSSEFEF